MSDDKISVSGLAVFVIIAELGVIVWLGTALHGARTALNNETELNTLITNEIQHPSGTALTLKDMEHWRDQYGYMVDSYKDLAVEKFGPPSKEQRLPNDQRGFMLWTPSDKTGGRQLTIELYASHITGIIVEPKSGENPYLVSAMQDAEHFSFKHDLIFEDLDPPADGSLSNNVLPIHQFVMTKNDGKMILTYRVTHDTIEFGSVEFR
jgi:hypothetical protein